MFKSFLFFSILLNLALAAIEEPGFFRSNDAEIITPEVTVGSTISIINESTPIPREAESDIVIDPTDMTFSVPDVPKNIGDKIIEQVRDQIGSQKLSLNEFKNRLEPFKANIPGSLVNKTIVTEIQETTTLNKTSRMLRPHNYADIATSSPQIESYSVPLSQNYVPKQETFGYVPQDYFYHSEPKIESKSYSTSYQKPVINYDSSYSSSSYQGPSTKPETSYQMPPLKFYNEPEVKYQSKQEYVPIDNRYLPQKKPECPQNYAEPKIVYKYIEVCTNPQYKKPQNNYNIVGTKTPNYKPNVVKTSTNGYHHSYSSQQNRPLSSYQQINNKNPSIPNDVSNQISKIQKEIREKLEELKIFSQKAQKEIEENFNRQPPYPKIYDHDNFLASFPVQPNKNLAPIKMTSSSYDNDNNIKVAYKKEIETFQT